MRPNDRPRDNWGVFRGNQMIDTAPTKPEASAIRTMLALNDTHNYQIKKVK